MSILVSVLNFSTLKVCIAHRVCYYGLAKIIKKSVILFWLLNMTICCKHAHRLELQKFSNLCAAHLPVRLDIETKFPYFLFWTCMSEIRNREFRRYIYSLTGNEMK